MRRPPLFTLLLVPLVLAMLGAPGRASAETRRLAIVVGNNAGGPSDKPLRYAEDDATKVADVLSQLGDVPADGLFLLRGQGRSDLTEALRRAAQRVADHRKDPTNRTVLLFYFSGHSDAEALELGGDRMPFAELRRYLAETRADVRVAIVDGCRSGAFANKGGTRAPPFEIRLLDQLDASGEAVLTSSAADEVALESREVRGSYFTHHLVSGLRGAADFSGDGRVTLAEAYQYAFHHTIAASAASGVRQHPSYDYRISGKGELVLTEIDRPSASLELPEGFERALVVLVRRDQVLAELSGGAARRIALAPGEYALRVWKGTQAYAARVTVVAGEARVLGWPELQPVASPRVAEKGSAEEVDVEGLSPEAQAEYLAKYYTVGSQVVVRVSGNSALVGNTPIIFQGRYRKEVDRGEFFRGVGRNDLAEDFELRRTLRWTLFGGAAAVLVGSVAYGIASRPGDCKTPVGDPNFSQNCVERPGSAVKDSVNVALVGGSVAAGLVLAGFLVNPYKVEEHELRRLADEHNAALRHRLGSPPAPSKERRDMTVFLLPGAGTAARGLTIGVTF